MKKLVSGLVAAAVAATMATTAMTASAATSYTLPVDDITQWVASTSNGVWTVPIQESEYITAEEIPGVGMRLSPLGQIGWPAGRVEDQTGTTGVCNLTENDYLNFEIVFEGDGETDAWELKLNLGANGTVSCDETIVKEVGVTRANNHMPAGTYQMSIKIADILKEGLADSGNPGGDALYNAVLGADGNNALLGFRFVAYAMDETDYLTIKSLTIGTDATYSKSTYTAPGEEAPSTSTGGSTTSTGGSTTSTGGSTTSTGTGSTTSTASKAPTTSKGGTSSQVSTGESVLPIIGIAALAVVATSAVVVSRKRK